MMRRIELTTFVGPWGEYNQYDHWHKDDFGYPMLVYQELDENGEVIRAFKIEDFDDLRIACEQIIDKPSWAIDLGKD